MSSSLLDILILQKLMEKKEFPSWILYVLVVLLCGFIVFFNVKYHVKRTEQFTQQKIATENLIDSLRNEIEYLQYGVTND
jgi:predicted permease